MASSAKSSVVSSETNKSTQSLPVSAPPNTPVAVDRHPNILAHDEVTANDFADAIASELDELEEETTVYPPSSTTDMSPGRDPMDSSPVLQSGGVPLAIRRLRPAAVHSRVAVEESDGSPSDEDESESSDDSGSDSDQGAEGGGVKLTPQPRRPANMPEVRGGMSEPVARAPSVVIEEGLRPGLTPARLSIPYLEPHNMPGHHMQHPGYQSSAAPPNFRMPRPHRMSSASELMDQATGAIPLPALPTRLPRNEEAASRTENNGDVFVEQPAPTRRLSVAGLHAAASRYVEPVPQVVQPPVEVQSRTSNRFINLNSQTFQPGRQLPHRQAQAQAQAATRPAGFTRGNPANVNPRFRNQARSAFQQSYSTFSGNNNFSRNPVAAGTGPFPPSPYAPIQGNQPRNFAHQQNRTMVPSMSYEYLASVTLPEFEKLGLPKVLTPPTTFTLLNGPASETFNYLTQHGKQRPPMDIAFQGRYEPFVQRALERRPLCAAILKIDELPYEVKNSDIVAYIGGTAKILNDNEEPIHIMMERITTKTGAAYVEFYDARSAYKVVEKHNNARTQGKPIRIQNRMVTASISSHDALMTDLFPCARGVTWRNGEPYVQSDNAFKGFVSEEELIGLVKNIEFPGRVPFSRCCPQRSVDTMISMIKKFPWHLTHMITLRQRWRFYQATKDMIETLAATMENLKWKSETHNDAQARQTLDLLGDKLIRRLISAAMNCPGFTVVMKDEIAYIAGIDPLKVLDYHLPWNADGWKHAYTLSPNPTCPLDVVDYYVALIREETTRLVEHLPLWLRQEVRAHGSDKDLYWGYYYLVLRLPRGDAFDNMTLRECAIHEFKAIDWIMRRVLQTRDPATAGPWGGPGTLALPPAPVRPPIALN